MVPVLTDENLSGPIIQAIQQSEADLDLVRVQDIGLMGADDRRLLEWAAEQDRVLLTHDRETVPHFAYERIRRGEEVIGVVVINDQVAPGQIVPKILSLIVQKDMDQFNNRVFFLSG